MLYAVFRLFTQYCSANVGIKSWGVRKEDDRVNEEERERRRRNKTMKLEEGKRDAVREDVKRREKD